MGSLFESLFCWGDKWRQLARASTAQQEGPLGRGVCWAKGGYDNSFFMLHFQIKRNIVFDIIVGTVAHSQMAFLLTALERS